MSRSQWVLFIGAAVIGGGILYGLRKHPAILDQVPWLGEKLKGGGGPGGVGTGQPRAGAGERQDEIAQSIAARQSAFQQQQQESLQAVQNVQTTLRSIQDINRVNRLNQQLQQTQKRP